MITRRRHRLVVAALAAGPLLALVIGGPAVADNPSIGSLASGYWDQEAAAAGTPAPPQVPAGGLHVASNPSGPSAVSAVRFSLLAGATAPKLTLSIASAQPAAGVAVIACRTDAPWSPPQGGSGVWGSRPAPACSEGQVAGAVDPAGTSVVFDLTPLAVGGVVDAVILPAAAATDPTGGALPTGAPAAAAAPTFDAAFAPVTTSSIATSAAAASPAASDGAAAPAVAAPTAPDQSAGPLPAPAAPPTASAASPVAAPPAVVGGGSAGLPASDVPQVAVGPLPGAPAGPLATATAPLPSAAPVAPVAAPGRSTLPYTPVRVVHGRSWRDRLLLAFLLFDLVGYAVYQGRRSAADGRPETSLYDVPPPGTAGAGALALSGRAQGARAVAVAAGAAVPAVMERVGGLVSGAAGKRRHAHRGEPPPIR